MARVRRVTLWAAAGVLGALAALSAVGAHLGPGWAAGVFRSAPMAGVWVVLTGALLVVAVLILSARPGRNAGLLACYGGAALILLGAMLGSATSHRVAAACWGSRKVSSGVMHIIEGQGSCELLDEQTSEPIATLPFEVRLERLEVVYRDSPSGGASQPGGAIKEFISHLVISSNGKVLARAVVGANRPLHYGGYHFTQTGCILGLHALTRLTVVSDQGLGVVTAGWTLLAGGLVWQLWLLPAVGYLRKRGARDRQD